MRQENTNTIVGTQNVGDSNLTGNISYLTDGSIRFKNGVGNATSDLEIQQGVIFRNSFKSSNVISTLNSFFGTVESAFQNFTFGCDSILFWVVKKKYSYRELTQYGSTGSFAKTSILPNLFSDISSFATNTWGEAMAGLGAAGSLVSGIGGSSSTGSAGASVNLSSFYDTTSDSIGVMANSKYLQLDTTLPIFDITQETYGVPIPFAASSENKISPTTRNIMYDLSLYNTALMRRNLVGVAYGNTTLRMNMAADATVPHGVNLINDLPTFTKINSQLGTLVSRIGSVIPGFKLFQYVCYLSNIGNKTGFNLRDDRPLQSSDKDFVVVTSAQRAQNALKQINEIASLSEARALIQRLAQSLPLTRAFVQSGRSVILPEDRNTDNTIVDNPEGEGVLDPMANEPGGQAYVEENPDGTLTWSDTGEPLNRFEKEVYLRAKEQALLNGLDNFDAETEANTAVQEYLLIRAYETGSSLPGTSSSGSGSTGTGSTTTGSINNNGYLALANNKAGGLPSNLQSSFNVNWKNRGTGNYSWFSGMIIHDDGSGGISQLPGLVSWASTSNNGYTAYIDRDGNWIQTVPFSTQTNHAGSGNISGVGNYNTIGVMLIGVDGNNPNKGPTQAQLNTLASAATVLGIQGVGGHGEYTTRKEANEGLAAAQYLRDTLGIGNLNAISSNPSANTGSSTVTQSTGTGNSGNSSSSGNSTSSGTSSSSSSSSTGTSSSTSSTTDSSGSGTTSLPGYTYGTAAGSTEETPTSFLSQLSQSLAGVSSGGYSNKQLAKFYTFYVKVGDVYQEVDYLMKSVVRSGMNVCKSINQRLKVTDKLEYVGSTSSADQLSSQTASILGLPADSPYIQAGSNLIQGILTSQNTNNILFGAGNTALNSILGSAQSNPTFQSIQGYYDGAVGALNQLGPVFGAANGFLPTTGDLINVLNPISLLQDLPIPSLLPSINLGSISELIGLAANIGSNGPPTSISGLLEMQEQIYTVICNFQFPDILAQLDTWYKQWEEFVNNFDYKEIDDKLLAFLTLFIDRILERFSIIAFIKNAVKNGLSIWDTIKKELRERFASCERYKQQDKSGISSTGGQGGPPGII